MSVGKGRDSREAEGGFSGDFCLQLSGKAQLPDW